MQHPALSTKTHDAVAPRWPRGSVVAVGLAVAAVLVSAALLAQVFALERAFVFRATVLALGGGAVVLTLAVRHLGAPTFGAANTVTLGRGALTMLLVALVGEQPQPSLAWLVVGLATLAAALDGVDGRLARHRGEASAFGARFDMETDALLILVLAVLVWQHGKAGAWVLLAGLLRYLFVAASYGWSWMGAALPPSRRRQTVCVVQIVSLIAALAPLFVRPLSSWVALAGLGALAWSFAVDVVWLARHARG